MLHRKGHDSVSKGSPPDMDAETFGPTTLPTNGRNENGEKM